MLRYRFNNIKHETISISSGVKTRIKALIPKPTVTSLPGFLLTCLAGVLHILPVSRRTVRPGTGRVAGLGHDGIVIFRLSGSSHLQFLLIAQARQWKNVLKEAQSL